MIVMRRKRKWLVCVGLLLLLLIIYGWHQKLDDHFTELSTCPACYGQGHCPTLLEDDNFGTNKINLVGYSKWKIMKLLNVKNVYYGETGTVSVVLKKLAHDSELYEYNAKLCKANREDQYCEVSQAIKSLMSKNNNNIELIINRYPQLFERSEGIICNHNRSLYHLYDKYVQIDSGPYQQHHFITMLAVNMEPLFLNAYHHSGWFPSLHGLCGRVLVEEYVGPTLTQLAHSPWLDRAHYARQLLEMAQHFSEGTFRLYMTDVSLDNFAVDTKGRVKLIDAENLVMVDPTVDSLERSEHINEGFGCRDCLSFSYEDLCGHTHADHNYFAICKGILSSHSFSRDLPAGLLHSPPAWVNKEHPTLLAMVEECARPPNLHDNTVIHRHTSAVQLQSELVKVLHKSGRG